MQKPHHENPILICMQNHFQSILQITTRFFGWTIEIIAKLDGYYFWGFEFQDKFSWMNGCNRLNFELRSFRFVYKHFLNKSQIHHRIVTFVNGIK